MERVHRRQVKGEILRRFSRSPSPSPMLLRRQRSKSFGGAQTSSPLLPRQELQVQLPKESPRSLNGSATSLSSTELAGGGFSSSPNPVRSGLQKLFGRNKDHHGSHSGKEESESEDSDLKSRLHLPPGRPKQFLNVLAQIRERAMPSSLGRARAKTHEGHQGDSRSSGETDSPGRTRGGTLTGGTSSSDQPSRVRSGTGLSSNDEDNIDADMLDGALSSQEKEGTDDVDGQIDSEKRRHAVEHLNRKIRKTREQIRQLQEERDEYVKEYLESTEGAHKTKAVKTHFEKKNQKTNAMVSQLQKKLEKYHTMLVELEMNGAAPSGHIAKEVLKGVKENIRGISGAVTKPLEIIKNRRFGSAENVSATTSSPGSKIDGLDEDPVSTAGEESIAGDTNLSPARYVSDDDSSSVTSATHMISIPVPGGSPRHSLPPSPPTCYDQDIADLRDTNCRLQEHVNDLRRKLDLVAESLQEERFKSEQLRYQLNDITNQWNDMTELHQNEMMSLKQELERAEERIELVEYRSAERASEIEEALDTHITRVMKIEALQQQNQQMTTKLDDYLDQSFQAKALLSKFLTMMLAILQILLIICSTFTRIVLPFTRTRCRIILSSIVVLIVFLLWKYQENDNVRLVKSRVTEHYGILRDKLEAMGVPFMHRL